MVIGRQSVPGGAYYLGQKIGAVFVRSAYIGGSRRSTALQLLSTSPERQTTTSDR